MKLVSTQRIQFNRYQKQLPYFLDQWIGLFHKLLFDGICFQFGSHRLICSYIDANKNTGQNKLTQNIYMEYGI